MFGSELRHQLERLTFGFPPEFKGKAEVDGHVLEGPLAALAQLEVPRTRFKDNDGFEVRFLGLSLLDPAEVVVADRGARALFQFGDVDGGNYLLVGFADPALDGDVRCARVDHYVTVHLPRELGRSGAPESQCPHSDEEDCTWAVHDDEERGGKRLSGVPERPSRATP